MTAHQAVQAPSLYPDIAEVKTPPGRGEHGYYRKAGNGWIVTAPIWPTFRGDMEYKGCVHLPQYGAFTIDQPWGVPNKDARGARFNSAIEPWRVIFQKGGAKEFPVEQVIAFRWHINPPYAEVTFPQLEDVEVHDLWCPECENVVFSALSEKGAVDQLRRHLTAGKDNAHSYKPTDLLALGTQWDMDFGFTGVGGKAVRRKERATAKGRHHDTQRERQGEVLAEATG